MAAAAPRVGLAIQPPKPVTKDTSSRSGGGAAAAAAPVRRRSNRFLDHRGPWFRGGMRHYAAAAEPPLARPLPPPPPPPLVPTTQQSHLVPRPPQHAPPLRPLPPPLPPPLPGTRWPPRRHGAGDFVPGLRRALRPSSHGQQQQKQQQKQQQQQQQQHQEQPKVRAGVKITKENVSSKNSSGEIHTKLSSRNPRSNWSRCCTSSKQRNGMRTGDWFCTEPSCKRINFSYRNKCYVCGNLSSKL